MENMCSILVYIYSVNISAKYISTEFTALVNHHAPLAVLMLLISESRTEKSGTYYKIIIMFHKLIVCQITVLKLFFASTHSN